MTTEKSTAFKKKGLKFLNSNLIFLRRIYSIFYEIPTFWSSEINKSMMEQVKVAEKAYGYMLKFPKKLKL